MSCGDVFTLCWGGISTASTSRARCVGAAGRGTFGCAGDPGRTVSCAGGSASFVRFSCPWGTVVTVTGTLSGSNPCGPKVGEAIVLKFTLGLN